MTRKIYLAGFSGTGKTHVGSTVARMLDWEFLDTDDEVTKQTGKSISNIFRDDGEEGFRLQERKILESTLAKAGGLVVSTGGGAFVDSDNSTLMVESGIVIALDARPETIYERCVLATSNIDGYIDRPLLEGEDPLARIKSLKAERQFAYSYAHWTIHTDGLSLEQVALEVIRAWRIVSTHSDKKPKMSLVGTPELTTTVETSSGAYPVVVDWGILPSIGELILKEAISGPVYLITDERVFHSHGRVVQVALQESGIAADVLILPDGESTKSLDTAGTIYQWLLERKAQRNHTLISLGGGVIGDLTGFVAATYNRGMSFIQVPTSLAAMVDASIGGKTAVNLPGGKNLVGVFHQPKLVVIDVKTLLTLSMREIIGGWAEAIKHGLLFDPELFGKFEQYTDALLSLDSEIATEIIKRSVVIKGNVVSQDERETNGYRTLLNYGHTIGHALEAATNYSTLLHGEAVAVGMMGAAFIGQSLGITPEAVTNRQKLLLERFGLPVRYPGIDIKKVKNAISVDKKADGRTIKWVFLEEVGKPTISSEVSDTLIEEALVHLIGN